VQRLVDAVGDRGDVGAYDAVTDDGDRELPGASPTLAFIVSSFLDIVKCV
jgi:hypothetical protein